MSLRTECCPVGGVIKTNNVTEYVIDKSRIITLNVIDESKGIVSCQLLSARGKCQGKFPCLVNKIDMYTTVTPVINP